MEAWGIVSQTVRNWRPSKPSRRRTSVAVTTWLTAVPTTEQSTEQTWALSTERTIKSKQIGYSVMGIMNVPLQ